MSNDPKVFLRNFEQKFNAFKHLPRLEFMANFKPREFHFYILIISEMQEKYRINPPYGEMLRTFPMDNWDPTIQDLLKKFVKKPVKSPRETGIENGRSFIEQICLEFPEYFTDQLDDLFIARIPFPGLYTRYMWKRFGSPYGQFLQLYVDTNHDDQGEQCRALSYALVTGNKELEKWAKNFIRHDLDIPRKFIEGLNLQAELLNGFLHEMGLEWRGNDIIQLYSTDVFHITFPYRYLHIDMDQESFYKLKAVSGPLTFGGAMQAQNKIGKRSKIQHIISLDPIPKFLPITGLYRILIAFDMDQVMLTTGASYQQHHSNGSITILDDNRSNYPAGKPALEQSLPYIKSTKVILSDQGQAFQFQRPGRPENYYRIGGAPTFLGQPYYPNCCSCDKTMPFLMQLDSTLPGSNEQPMEWGIDGMAYIYWCDKCKISAVQYTSE